MKFHKHYKAMTLVEILISMMIMSGLMLLLGVVIRAMGEVRLASSNKVAQASVFEVQKAYTRFVSNGGWISTDLQTATHITTIMDNLDNIEVINNGLQINGRTPTTSIACSVAGGFTCYRLQNNSVLAVRHFVAPAPENNPTNITDANGYFAPPNSQATQINGRTHQPIIIDPDGAFVNGDPSSASVHLFIDSLGRITPRNTGTSTVASVTVEQPAYFNLQR
jgi:type II secretory pathway pseudopilin PulG